ASEELAAFVAHGLEDDELLGAAVKRIPGTSRVFPAVEAFDAAALRERLTFHALGRLSAPDLGAQLATLMEQLPRAAPGATHPPRLHVEIPTVVTPAERPSRVDGHQVIRRRPLDVWEELVVRVTRFGRPVTLDSGPRQELLGVKAVIAEPV